MCRLCVHLEQEWNPSRHPTPTHPAWLAGFHVSPVATPISPIAPIAPGETDPDLWFGQDNIGGEVVGISDIFQLEAGDDPLSFFQ